MDIFKKLKFDSDPFAYTNADEEDRLSLYFIKPPYFESVVGDPTSPSSCIVIAPRGAGKTAQRKMVEEWCVKNNVLSVTYDRFEFNSNTDISSISLNYHLRNIIANTLVNLILWTSENRDLIKELSKNQKTTLNILCHTYLGSMTGENIQEIINRLRTFPQKLKDFWRKNVGVLDSILTFLLKTYEFEEIDLPNIPQEEKKIHNSYKYQLELLAEISNTLKFKAIYVLIDKVDETELTGNSPEDSFKLIKPLLLDLEVLQLKGYGFKFFLWDKIFPYYLEIGRPDRIKQYELNWKKAQLKEMLSRRIEVYSNGKIKNILQLFTFDIEPSIEEIIIYLGWLSPRNVIRFCERIISEQAQIDSNSSHLTLSALDRASVSFSESLSYEYYKREIIRDLKKIDKEVFSISYLTSNIFKSTTTDARNKVTSFESCGAVKKIGKEKKNKSSKPTNLYYIVDPRLNRLINSSIRIDKLLKNNIQRCSSCGEELFIDANNLPESCDIYCWKCDNALFSGAFNGQKEINIDGMKADLRKFLATNKLESAINHIMINFVESPEIYENVLMISSRLNQINKERALDIISSQDYNRSLNKIRFSILRLIESI